MGKKNKLQRFAEMKEFNNVFEPSWDEVRENDFYLKNSWNEAYFKNSNPIVLELGCGKGEYTLGMSEKHPHKNFAGVDIKGARMWKGAKAALENKLYNVAFLRTRIEFIDHFFGKDEVDEIWLTFPDPQPRKGRAKKRLTSPVFLDKYRAFLKPEGIIHLKTDSKQLHDYTLDVIKNQKYELLDATDNLYGNMQDTLDEQTRELLSIKTFYEKMFLEEGKPITYLKFRMSK